MATIHELHKKLVNKEISAVELTNAVIAHKAKVEPTVHAYLSDSHDRALATAKLVDEAIEHAADAVEKIITDGADAAMNEYNRKKSS